MWSSVGKTALEFCFPWSRMFYLEATRDWLCSHDPAGPWTVCTNVGISGRGLECSSLLQITESSAQDSYDFFFHYTSCSLLTNGWFSPHFSCCLFTLFRTNIHLTFLQDQCLCLSWEMSLQEVTIWLWIRWEGFFLFLLKPNNKVITIRRLRQNSVHLNG